MHPMGMFVAWSVGPPLSGIRCRHGSLDRPACTPLCLLSAECRGCENRWEVWWLVILGRGKLALAGVWRHQYPQLLPAVGVLFCRSR
jgi:hypothetical protein